MKLLTSPLFARAGVYTPTKYDRTNQSAPEIKMDKGTLFKTDIDGAGSCE